MRGLGRNIFKRISYDKYLGITSKEELEKIRWTI